MPYFLTEAWWQEKPKGAGRQRLERDPKVVSYSKASAHSGNAATMRPGDDKAKEGDEA